MKFQKNLIVITALSSILNYSQADYTAKIFVEGVSLNSNTGQSLPPSDPTEQVKGDANFLVKLSRTSAYQGEIVNLIVESNSEDCVYIEEDVTKNIITDFCSSWGTPLPFTANLMNELKQGNNLFNVYQVESLYSTPIRTETFNINVLIPQDNSNSDNNLKYNVSRTDVPLIDYESFYVNFYDNTYDCVDFKHINSGNIISSYCERSNDQFSLTPYSQLDPIYQLGRQDFALVAYDQDGGEQAIPESIKEYPFSVNIITTDTSNLPVITDDTYIEEGYQFYTFDSLYLGASTFSINNIIFGLINTETISVSDIDGYTSGTKNVNSDGETPLKVRSTDSNYFDLIATATNENGSTTKTFNYYLNKTIIDDISIKWCFDYSHEDPNTCDYFPQSGNQGSMAIWNGGTGDSATLTFKADNAECVTISSSNDSNYTTPVTRCYYDDSSSIFYFSYPNHDPVGQTQKVYNYQIRATNSDGEDFTKNFSMRIYYD